MLLTAGPAHAMVLGISDAVYDPGANPETQAAFYSRTVSEDATRVRITAIWRDIAPVAPSGDAGAAANPAYRFEGLDQAVRAAAASGREILLLVAVAPDWALGTRPSSVAGQGAWRPDPKAFGLFARAVASRYAGTFDPGDGGGTLPFVKGFQLWNEPNLSTYLAPQWRKVGKRYIAESPELYRGLVNAAYPQIKAASPQANVVEAGTAPYGDPKAGGTRIPPALFTRALLCEGGTSAAPKPLPCPAPVHLDTFSHHPYGVGGPFESDYYPDDVTLSSLGRLTRAWRLAERTGRVLPRGTRPRWVTEFGWESKPDPSGLSHSQQAAWLGQALYQLDRAGFSGAFWYRIRDDAPLPSYGRSAQSGLFLRDGTPKPSAAMYVFAVAAVRRSGGRLAVFARPPASGRCVAQRRRGTRWVTVTSGNCRAGRPFTRTVKVPSSGRFRVVVGSAVSPVVSASN